MLFPAFKKFNVKLCSIYTYVDEVALMIYCKTCYNINILYLIISNNNKLYIIMLFYAYNQEMKC